MLVTRPNAIALLGLLTLSAAAAPPVAPPKKEAPPKGAEGWKEAEFIETKANGVYSMAFTPDGTSIVADTLVKGIVVVNIATGNQKPVVFRQARTYNTGTFQLSADGKLLLCADKQDGAFVWDLEKGKLLSSVAFPTPEKVRKKLIGGIAGSAAISSEGARAVAGWDDGRVRVWDMTSGNEVLTFEAHQGEVRGVAFSPDGKTLASLPSKAAAKLWDATSGKELATLPGGIEYPSELRFSPNGKILMGMGGNGIVHWWDVATGKTKHRIETPRGLNSVCVVFSPDSKTIAMAELGAKTVRLVDVETGKDRALLKWEGVSTILGVSFSPDGKVVAAGDDEGDIQLWEAPTEKK